MAKNNQLLLINDAVIFRRLFGIYKMLQVEKYDKLRVLVNDTIWDLQHAEEYEVDKFIVNQIINTLYTMLVDIAMKRYNTAHSKIRDLRYAIDVY